MEVYKKKKVNGKWRYYYDTSELKKYNHGHTEVAKGIATDGTGGINQWKVTKQYVKGEDFVDKVITSKVSDPRVGDDDTGYEAVHVTYSQGRLSRYIARAEKWVFDHFLSPLVKEEKKK